jgi:hypothetical protein
MRNWATILLILAFIPVIIFLTYKLAFHYVVNLAQKLANIIAEYEDAVEAAAADERANARAEGNSSTAAGAR